MKPFGSDGPHFCEEVKAIEEWARSATRVATLRRRSTEATAGWMAGKATRARVARCDEQNICGETGAFIAAFDADFAFFEGLAQALEGGALKLGELVEKEHPAVGAREFTGPKWAPAAEQRLSRNAVVRGTKRRALRKRLHRAMQGLE